MTQDKPNNTVDLDAALDEYVKELLAMWRKGGPAEEAGRGLTRALMGYEIFKPEPRK